MSKTGDRRWEIQHIDLSAPLQDLAASQDIDGICAFFWWHQIPLGQIEILSQGLPLSAEQLLHRLLPLITPIVGSHLLEQGFQTSLPGAFSRWQQDNTPDFARIMALHHPLKQLQHQWETTAAQSQETVSVVICTRDRPEQLVRCLRSLQSLVDPPHEIIVIDNAPCSGDTQRLVAQYPGVRYYCEPRPGLSIARNTGIAQATGSLIAFTDDDVEVHPHWIKQLRTAFQFPNVMAMTGLILPARLETEAERVFQQGPTSFGWGYHPLNFDTRFFEEMKPLGVPVWRIGAGANMAFRRQVFNVLGGFDERLGAGASGCSEDSEFWYRVLAAGWICRYHPTAVVFHYHRDDLTNLNQQKRAYMRGHITALLVQAERYHHWGNLRRAFIALPRHYSKLVILGSLQRFNGRYCTVFSEIGGCLSGIGFYLRHRGQGTIPSFPKPSTMASPGSSALLESSYTDSR